MQSLNKSSILKILSVLSVLICAISWWVFTPSKIISQQALRKKINANYKQQFCTVIFPRFSKCVSLQAAACPTVVEEELHSCSTKILNAHPAVISQEDAKSLYQEVGECLQAGMHERLVKDYLLDTEECRAMMQ